MAHQRRAAIAGCGMYLPDHVMTNHDLERLVDTADEWIVSRTGIRERRIARPDQAASDLALPAARQAIAEAGLQPADLDLILCASMTPDMNFPSTGCFLQAKLDAVPIPALDVLAACSGYGYSLALARGMICAGLMDHILVIGTEVLSKFTDWTDRSSCILFGDGAGATVVSACEEGGPGEILYTTMGADGIRSRSMTMPAGGSANPPTHETVDARMHFVKLRGREVYQLAVRQIVEVINECVQACGLTTDDIDLVVPHQMNERIMQAAVERLDMEMDHLYVNIDRYGNTGAATVPIALHEAHDAGRLGRGDVVVLVTFGAGLSWSGAVLRW
ncbi:MAG: beta-ketoacyl-ACP synthase III [Planctomycetota bacterium]